MKGESVARSRGIALHPTHGEMDEFARGGELKLALDVEAMDFDSLDAEVQFFRNVPRIFAVADQLEDFKLAIGEALNACGGCLGAVSRKCLEDAGRSVRADVDLPAQDLAYRLHQLFATCLLHHVAAPARSEHTFGVKAFLMHGHHEHECLGMHRVNVANQLKSAATGQRYVYNHEIGFELRRLFDSSGRAVSFTRDSQILFAIDELRESLAHHRVIVHDEDLFCLL